METVNLKGSITFRVPIEDRTCSFTTKCFVGERLNFIGSVPDNKDRVMYKIHQILIDSETMPWFTLDVPQTLSVSWASVVTHQPVEESK